jgi:hypothetical protein
LLVFMAFASLPRFAVGQGEPLGPEFRVNTHTTSAQVDPRMAADNFVVVWESDAQDGSSDGVFGQRYASTGDPLGPEFRVNDFTTNAQAEPLVASSASGEFVVVWQSAGQDGLGPGAFGQRYAASGSPLGPEFQVNTYTTGNQSLPKVATDPAGNFVVAWASLGQDGSADGVFAQRYSASGMPLGSEFRVNTYTTNGQSFPSVTASANGTFVVAWESNTQDGSGDGVFAQRFGPIVPVELMRFEIE